MKRYQDDFKASIVKMHREEKRSIRSLSEEYGVSSAAIHNWVWSPVNKIDNLNRDFFVLCHD